MFLEIFYLISGLWGYVGVPNSGLWDTRGVRKSGSQSVKQNVSYFEFYKQSKDGVIIWQMQQQKEFIAIIIKSDLYFDASN